MVGQRLTASNVGARWDCLDRFPSPIISLFFLPLSGMDGWMTWNFTSFSTEFKFMTFTIEKIPLKRGSNPGLLDQQVALNQLSYRGFSLSLGVGSM